MEHTYKKKAVYGNPKPINWQALAYFNFYRLLLSGLFILLLYIGQLPQPLGILNEKLFSIVSHSFFIIAILFNFFIKIRYPRYNLQIAFHVLIDICALTLLMYSSNGLSSGFGMLIIIAVAGGSILREGKIAILFAAIATLAVLGHEFYIQFFKNVDTFNYTHAGILGATFFVTAFIGNLLSARVRRTEKLAEEQAIEINELAKINEHIVHRMQSGIVVLDSNNNVLLMNDSARILFSNQRLDIESDENYISNLLKKYLDAWVLESSQQNMIIQPEGSEHELQVSFIKLKQGNSYRILVFIENIAELRQRAQQLKLASLGRLTASIAHEVRNPLGAINHASQLLEESSLLSVEDKRLVEIINEHSLRVNNIIENIMSISRREKSTSEKVDIYSWLTKFADELRTRLNLNDDAIELKIEKEDLLISMDTSQLNQILWNLCENGLRYSSGMPLITIYCGINDAIERPYIDVVDYGNGISQDNIHNLFEPFFTTEAKGSGLGLYIARELCEANQATLNLLSSSSQGSTFRVSFKHIDKQDLII